jgi:hypothetical protein
MRHGFPSSDLRVKESNEGGNLFGDITDAKPMLGLAYLGPAKSSLCWVEFHNHLIEHGKLPNVLHLLCVSETFLESVCMPHN